MLNKTPFISRGSRRCHIKAQQSWIQHISCPPGQSIRFECYDDFT